MRGLVSSNPLLSPPGECDISQFENRHEVWQSKIRDGSVAIPFSKGGVD